MINLFLPEGRLTGSPEQETACATAEGLARARDTRQILEGRVLCCTPGHDLTVSLGPFTGLIPREEVALGIAEGRTKEIAILSRVGKCVSFTVESLQEKDGVLCPLLSRRAAQRMALRHMLDTLLPGMVIPATVTHLEPFGAFVDIGCGFPSMIGIENLSVSRIPHPDQRLAPGQQIYAAVTGVDPDLERVSLTHKELLGTWAENIRQFRPGMTVLGRVRGIKEYGAFIELAPNLSGLAEPRRDLREGDRVSVYIKSILPQRMKLKLLIIDRLPPEPERPALHYFITGGRLRRWRYAPEECLKSGAETVFY